MGFRSVQKRVHPDFEMEITRLKKELGLDLNDSQATKILADQLKLIRSRKYTKKRRRKRDEWLNIDSKIKL